MSSEKTKAFFGFLIIMGFFVLSSYLVKTNIEFVQSLIKNNFLGVVIYIIITIIAVVIAPISMMPLIPIASNLWGWFNAGLINILGWSIGSFIVFFICRKYGVNLIKKFISLESLNKFESKIPKENLFIDIILLRMIFPVDILSYILSLFSKVNFNIYSTATIIGLIPFAFIFSYLGTVKTLYQIIGIFIIVLVITTIHIIREFIKCPQKK